MRVTHWRATQKVHKAVSKRKCLKSVPKKCLKIVFIEHGSEAIQRNAGQNVRIEREKGV